MSQLAAILGFVLFLTVAAYGSGELELRVIDQSTGRLTDARLHLTNSRQRPVLRPRHAAGHDSLTVDRLRVLSLPNGRYTFEIRKGLEYLPVHGNFLIEQGAADNHQVALNRFVTMRELGWWSGDLQVRSRLADLALLMRADDLQVAARLGSGADHTGRVAAQFPPPPDSMPPGRPLVVTAAEVDQRPGLYRSRVRLVNDRQRVTNSPGSQPDAKAAWHYDVCDGASWDLPLWLATDRVDSMALLGSRHTRTGDLLRETGRPRDADLFPPPLGAGRWAQHIYYQVLEAGFQLPPSAGSDTGRSPNPIGYNRVYVHLDEPFGESAWWEGLRAGRVFVTNGPLIDPRFNGKLPGHVFRADAEHPLTLEIELQLWTREKIAYLEVIKNGAVINEVRLDQWAKANGQLAPVTFEESGWLLIRAVADNADTHRLACSGPVFVRIGNRPRISRKAVQFFLDWLEQRSEQMAGGNAAAATAAQEFWQERLGQATSP